MFGLREKLALLSLFAFFLVAGVAVPVMYAHLNQQFIEVESEEATAAMQQLVRNLRSELDHLNDLNSDWGNWDALYAYTAKGGTEFANTELGTPTLLSARINLMAVFDEHGTPRLVRALDVERNSVDDAADFDDVIAAVRADLARDKMNDQCGLTGSKRGVMLLCWQAVRHADRTGDYVGSLLMGRLLTKTIIERIRNQSALDFDIVALTSKAVEGAVRSTFSASKLQLDPDIDGLMTAQLSALDGSAVAQVNLRYSQLVSQRGQRTARFVAGSMMLVVILAGMVQFVAAHLLVVRPVRRIGQQLREISSRQEWAKRLAETGRHDELGAVGHDINDLLAVIDSKFRELEEVSMTDSLTRIANRRAFDSRLAKELRQRVRTGRALSLLLIDIDYFKRYNDRYGHPAGDAALVAVAAVLAEAASRPGDLAARIGGEEFAVLLPDTELSGALALVERLRVQLASRCIPHAASEVSPFLTISIGVTTAGDESAETFVARADAALYQAKAGGRHQVASLLPPGASQTSENLSKQ